MPSMTETQNKALLFQIKAIHHQVNRVYGSPRMTAALNREGYRCGKNRVARLMRNNAISAKMHHRYKPRQWTSRSKIKKPNMLDGQAFPTQPHHVWVADLTYIKLGEKMKYLSVVMDLCTRKVLGYELCQQRNSALVIRTLDKAGKRNKPPEIFHSDRGSEFANHSLGGYLVAKGIKQSMSGKGNCYDNAHMESFFHSFKTEAIYPETIRTWEELSHRIKKWMKFYNQSRLHSSIGYTSPIAYEKTCT